MSEEGFFQVLDDQNAVGFTGKVNILDRNNSAHLGAVEFKEGDVENASFEGATGLKGFYAACVADFDGDRELKYIVEPEFITASRRIHFPYSVLKKKAGQVVTLYKESRRLRPPGDLKLLLNPGFVEAGPEVSGDEFDLMVAIADHNKVEDIYKNSELLDYQITNALVSLRKKKAMTVVKQG